MKAIPLIYENGEYVQVEPSRATHVRVHLPGPSGVMTFPVITKGTREGTGKWTWNGDTEKPTLRPSLLTTSGHFCASHKEDDDCWCTYNKDNPNPNHTSVFQCFRCHTWLNDGHVQFLPDCSHEFVGQTLDLLDV